MDISAVILANAHTAARPDQLPAKDGRSVLVRMLAGKPMITWVRDSLAAAGAADQLYILGSEHEDIRAIIGEAAAFSFFEEEERNSVILQAANFIESRSGITIVMPANLPLLGSDVLVAAIEQFTERGCDALVLTTVTDQSDSWERIVRDTRGIFLGSRREEELPPSVGKREINGEVYLFNTARLLSAIGKMGHRKSQNGDMSALLEIMMAEGRAVGTMKVSPDVLLPIDDLFDNNIANHILNGRIIRKHVENGVEFIDAEQTFVEQTVQIGQGTVIWPGTVLTGDTRIGDDVVIGASSVIESSQIGHKSQIRQSVIQNSYIGERCEIGPFAHLHDGAWLDRDVKVGTGTDISNAIVGYGVIIDAQVLINDADIGDSARIGAGAITVNEDASGHSFRTTIGTLAMIGSNTSLVAPVEIEANSYVAAGSVITGNVPAFALAVGRSRQTILEDWVRRGSAKREPV